jgi:hypothetical protein
MFFQSTGSGLGTGVASYGMINLPFSHTPLPPGGYPYLQSHFGGPSYFLAGAGGGLGLEVSTIFHVPTFYEFFRSFMKFASYSFPRPLSAMYIV